MFYGKLSNINSKEVIAQFDFFPSPTVNDDAPDVVQMINEIAVPTRPLKEELKVKKTNWNTRYGGAY